MFKVNGKNIYISRGEDAVILITAVNENGEEYVPAQGDVMSFTVRDPVSGEKVMQLSSTDGAVGLPAEKTAGLAGKYNYEAALKYADGRRAVIIGRTPNSVPHLYVMEG